MVIDYYPTKIPANFDISFTRLSDAKEFAKNNKGVVSKIDTKNYSVNYDGFIDNTLTTGRKFFILDFDIVDEKIVTLTRNIQTKNMYKVNDYQGEFILVGGLYADILCSINFFNTKQCTEIVKTIVDSETLRYINIREIEKQNIRFTLVENLYQIKNRN